MATSCSRSWGAFTEFEPAHIRERHREGIALAKHRGAYRGRKKTPHRNGRPSWPSALPAVFRNLLWHVITASAGGDGVTVPAIRDPSVAAHEERIGPQPGVGTGRLTESFLSALKIG